MNESLYKATENEPKFSSKIRLKFFRHDEKTGGTVSGNTSVVLTEEGKKHAAEQAELTNIDQAIAFGSSRERALHTSAFHMAGNLDTITGEESLEELTEKIDSSIKPGGTKVVVEPNLDYVEMDQAKPLGHDMVESVHRGEWLKYLVEESDQAKERYGEKEIMSYSDYAANIAKIVRKYLDISPRFNKLVEEKGTQYEPVLDRFMATHQGIAETFLAKVIEKTAGLPERKKFIQSLDNNGLGFSEGYGVEIVTPDGGGEPILHISFKKEGKNPEESYFFDQNVPISIVDEIILEGQKTQHA